MLPCIVDCLHVTLLIEFVRRATVPVFRLPCSVVPAPKTVPEQGLVLVEQSVVGSAEAAPTPTSAVRAIAAIAARPSIFRYFISFSSPAFSWLCVLDPDGPPGT